MNNCWYFNIYQQYKFNSECFKQEKVLCLYIFFEYFSFYKLKFYAHAVELDRKKFFTLSALSQIFSWHGLYDTEEKTTKQHFTDFQIIIDMNKTRLFILLEVTTVKTRKFKLPIFLNTG